MTRNKTNLMSFFCWSRVIVLLVSAGLMIATLININASNNKKIEKLARECQSGNVKSCLKLTEIAKSDKKWTVRQAAVEKLNDQTLLAEIAKTDKETDVRKSAVKKLSDQTLLAEIAKTDKESNVRQEAVEKLTDQTLLTTIAKTDENGNVRRRAVEKITDQVLFAEIAKSDSEVNMDALKMLTDQNCLLDVAKNAVKVEIRMSATEKLTDLAAIAEVIKAESDWHAKFIALMKQEDQSLLAIIAKERLPTSIDIENGKIELLPGETVRTEIRTGVKIIMSVWQSLQDKNAISMITINPRSIEFEGKTIKDIPTFAAMRLTEQPHLVDVAKNAFRASVRLVAVEKLTDKTLLSKIAKTDKDSDVRKAAQKRLEQPQKK